MKYQWRVEFKKVTEKGLRRGVDKVTEAVEVVVYAGSSTEALDIAARHGGIATAKNACCVTRLM
jgi:alkanesulfonate monooxygenase SsuD/methylene tetrahydromethanopterin reductase-like flavin-dependent oxidoreductase (luciferase family)